MKIFNSLYKYCGAGLAVLSAAAMTLASCTENIDDSDLYTFTGETIIDHFENNPETFSSYLTMLERVHPSKKSESTMKDLLSARGNYTCFAPTNEAIAIYLDSLMKLAEPQVSSTDISQVPDSIAEAIVFNSIIENGNNEAYPTTSFTADEPLGTTNMNDRYISISYGVDADNNTIVYVNMKSRIVEADIEVENGYIHAIDHVLSPSNDVISDVLLTVENLQTFGHLLQLTGWDRKLNKCKDDAWDEKYDDIRGMDFTYPGTSWKGKYPEHRKIKYTIFAETDSVFKANGIDVNDINTLKQWLREHAFYGPETSWDNDYENEDNAVNQFVSYHLLPEDLTTKNMVTYANEYGRSAAMMKEQGDKLSERFYVNVWEYWETMGKQRRSIKITATRTDKFINRKSVYNNKRTGSYREVPSKITMPGIKINQENNDTFNGHYYTIEDMLVWSREVPEIVLNERMRYDVTALFPEFMTNNIRQVRANGNWYFNPQNQSAMAVDYLENLVDMSNETTFIYLSNVNYEGGAGSWMNYQIDEFNIRGIVDFTMKLPPVPYTGTYEIRYGMNSNNNRGMAQIYLGKNWRNLPAVGIPLDLRESAIPTTTTGWRQDSEFGNDEDAINEADKNMRNLGYMKAPKYIQVGDRTGRDVDHRCIRKIIYTGQLEAGETYYIRFKSVLPNDCEFFYDYLEVVPKSIYAGEKINEDGVLESEDKW